MKTFRTIASMLVALRQLRQRDRWTRQQIESHQARALQRLRTHAYTHSPFYRKFHHGLSDCPLWDLPVLSKATLAEHFDEIVTDRAVRREQAAAHVRTLHDAERFLGRYIVTATSGTTGAPGYMLYNHAEWATVLASFTRYEAHVGSLWGAVRRPRMAVVSSLTPSHMSALVGATVRSSWLPMLRLDVGEPLASLVRQLNAWQPQLLATYASMAGILADEQQAGRLQISPVRIVCTAEVLTPELRRRLEEVWGPIIFNQYGASEGGAFAMECEAHAGLHLFEDLVILEVVDRQNRPVPPGSYGDKVLLTVLFNYTLPLIRYELSDSVRLATTRCPCGRAFALLDSILGRQEEVLRLPDASGGSVAVHPMLFYRILDAAPVAGWQVVQEPDRLRLCLNGQAERVCEESVMTAVRQALERQGALPPPLVVEWQQAVARGKTGKASRITSRLNDVHAG